MRKVIALDIGGTNTRVALINEHYEIESIKIEPTSSQSVDAFLATVETAIRAAVTDFSEVVAIASGVPGRVRHDGFIFTLPNVHITDVPLSAFLHEKFGLPVFVINDAEVAALSEANIGPYRDCASLFFITISTGIGGALTVNGKLHNSSFEPGHTIVKVRDEYHELEHYASGAYLPRLAALYGVEVKDARTFFERVKAGDKDILPIYQKWLELLSGWIKLMHAEFEPDVFTVTGGVMKSKDVFFKDLQKACAPIRVEECGGGQEAGLLGAAVLGFQSLIAE